MAGRPAGRLRRARRTPRTRRGPPAVKPPRFDYVRATSVEEAIEVLAAHGDDARVLAGGQSLVAMLSMRLLSPAVVVDISRVPEIATIDRTVDAIEIGAGVTQAEAQRFDGLGAHLPLVARALPFVGHSQTRTRGTVCGSIAHADPSSEMPLCLAALDGEVVLRSARGTRVMAAADFQQGMLTTACAADEMIVSVRFPRHICGDGCAFNEFGIRHGDFAIVAVAAIASAARVRVAVGGCSDRPHVADLPPLEGDALEGDALDERLNALAWSLPFDDDRHASARYRRDLVRTLGKQTVEKAIRCRS